MQRHKHRSPEAVACLEGISSSNENAQTLATRYKHRKEAADLYVESYRRYCWPIRSVNDLKLAPFHLLATEGNVHINQNHVWHMEKLAEICNASDGMMIATPFKQIDVTDAASVEAATQWWQELTARGGEGMVVKPFDFVATGRRGITQPAIKCRGKEYLRIIYGPEYLLPENLERLRSRGVSGKRSLALREFALGIEALERLSAANHFGASTNVFSAFSRSNLSQSIRDFNLSLVEPGTNETFSEQSARKIICPETSGTE